MRSHRVSLPARFQALGLRGLFSAMAELLAWTAMLAGLELAGRLLPAYDVASLGVLTLLIGPLGLGVVALGRRGWLPLASALWRKAGAAVRRTQARLSPGYEFAFRLGPQLRPRHDGVLLTALAAAGLALAGVLLFPGSVFACVAWLRSVSFALELLLLALLWGALLVVLTLGLLLETQRGGVPRTMLIWIGGLGASAVLPGLVPVGALLICALVTDRRLRSQELTPYLFCRRNRQGEISALRAQTLLRRAVLLGMLAIALALTLGHSERLLRPGVVQGAHAFTAGLAVLASVPAVLLALRVGSHAGHLMCVGREPPETPLIPTLWWADVGPAPEAVTEVTQDGWALLHGPRPAADAYDLHTPPKDSTRALTWDPAAAPAQRSFARLRRFHVVHRREALRRLQSLWKLARAEPGPTRSAILFCPHVWLIHSLLRDTGSGAEPIGPLFENVMAARTRRYWGQVLRSLGLDLVYWEGAVRWADLRRVLGVAFECYDQGRVPLEERHFVGLPRVRVLIQRDSGPGEPPPPQRSGLPQVPIGGGARVLMILKDQGGEPVRDRVGQPSDRRPAPQPV